MERGKTGKQGEEEEEIRTSHFRIGKIKNRNPWREILHPTATDVEPGILAVDLFLFSCG